MKIKKLLSFVLVFVLILTCTFALSGCKSANEDLKIVSHRLCKDGDDNDVIIIKFDFQNNSGYTTSVSDEYYITLYQNDVALEEYYDEYDEDGKLIVDFQYDSEGVYKQIRDGGRYSPEMAFYLDDSESDVEVVIESYSLFNRETTKIIKLK